MICVPNGKPPTTGLPQRSISIGKASKLEEAKRTPLLPGARGPKSGGQWARRL